MLLAPKGVEALCGSHLQLLIETVDPTIIVCLDNEAASAVSEALCLKALPAKKPMRQSQESTTDAGGRLLVYVDGFEAALNSESDKQRVWQQLKQASCSNVIKRFK